MSEPTTNIERTRRYVGAMTGDYGHLSLLAEQAQAWGLIPRLVTIHGLPEPPPVWEPGYSRESLPIESISLAIEQHKSIGQFKTQETPEKTIHVHRFRACLIETRSNFTSAPTFRSWDSDPAEFDVTSSSIVHTECTTLEQGLTFLTAWQKAISDQIDGIPNSTNPRRRTKPLLGKGKFDPLVNFTTNTSRIGQGTHGILASLPQWKQIQDDRHACTHQRKRFQFQGSLPTATWEVLKNQPATVLKLWHVLEAIRHANSDPMAPVTITPDRLLRELQPGRKTVYRPSEKEEALKLVDDILDLECSFAWKDRNGHKQTARGKLYIRTLSLESPDDLFAYLPRAVRIMANPDLHGNHNTEFARQTAEYHKGFLTLNTGTDAGALILGSYILIWTRMQSTQYQPGESRIKNKVLVNLLQNAGLLDLKKLVATRNLAQVKKRIERDLNKLISVGVITAYNPITPDRNDIVDGTLDSIEDIITAFPDNLDDVDTGPADKRRKRGPTGKLGQGSFYDWIDGTTQIHMPAYVEAEQLASRLTQRSLIAKAASTRKNVKSRVANSEVARCKH